MAAYDTVACTVSVANSLSTQNTTSSSSMALPPESFLCLPWGMYDCLYSDQCSTHQGYNDETQFSLSLEAKLTDLSLCKKFVIFSKS